jgi:molybdenum cofactor cytidylyltransferase
MPSGPALKLGAIILAAGNASRMGRPKMLLPWGDTTILGHLIAVWSGLLAGQIIVVHSAMDAELDRLQFPIQNRITNPHPDRGMFSSIQCAACWTGWHESLTHWVIVLGDQPHLRLETLKGMIDFTAHQPGKICQPSSGGHAKHPVFLSRTAFNELTKSTHKTLKEFLQSKAADVRLAEMNDPGLNFDIDSPEDYEKTLRSAIRLDSLRNHRQ